MDAPHEDPLDEVASLLRSAATQPEPASGFLDAALGACLMLVVYLCAHRAIERFLPLPPEPDWEVLRVLPGARGEAVEMWLRLEPRDGEPRLQHRIRVDRSREIHRDPQRHWGLRPTDWVVER